MPKKAIPARHRNEASVREKAYLHIQKIASGELQSGTAVSELSLAKELGSSRTPVREAVGQLVAEGLLEQTPNRGAVVVQLGRQDILDLYELRDALETYAIAKAAHQQVSVSDLERLQNLADEVLILSREVDESKTKILSAPQACRLISADLSFHALLMRLAANGRILKLVNEARLLIRIFAMRHRRPTGGELVRIHREHTAIIQAVADQDAELAVRLLSEHIRISQRERLEEFDHREREASLRDSVPSFLNELVPAE
jgi:DNA-binding GntR family transcriptional regulator